MKYPSQQRFLSSSAINPAQGYLGGWVDAATGLIYVGNGQYYDPHTGRFLTRDAQPGRLNPYAPRTDPTGLLVLARGRKGKNGSGKADVLQILLSDYFHNNLSGGALLIFRQIPKRTAMKYIFSDEVMGRLT